MSWLLDEKSGDWKLEEWGGLLAQIANICLKFDSIILGRINILSLLLQRTGLNGINLTLPSVDPLGGFLQ